MSVESKTIYKCDLCGFEQNIVVDGNYPIYWTKIRFGRDGMSVMTYFDICDKCNIYAPQDQLVIKEKKSKFILWLLKMGAWTKE